MSEGNAKRRWFRFGLRTMFVVVTVFACWLGWEISRIRQRTAAKTWISDHQGVWGSYDYTEGDWVFLRGTAFIRENEGKFSLMRRFLRDTPVMFIAFPNDKVGDADIDRLRDLFPEAFVTTVPMRLDEGP